MTPVAHAEHAHGFRYLFGHGIGANGAAAKEGATWSPFLTKCGGV